MDSRSWRIIKGIATYSLALVYLLLVVVLILQGCSSNEGPEPVLFDSIILNSSFEDEGPVQMPSGWKTSGPDEDADFLYSDGFSGKTSLRHEKDDNYSVFTYQELTDLDPGYYSLVAYIKNGGGQNACYLSADVAGTIRMTSLPVSKNIWTKVIVRGIEVTDGTLTIGLKSDGNGGNWCQVDDLELIKEDDAYVFLKGGDLSLLSYIEQMGGKFYENGEEKDCFEILKSNGMNLARLRLYNDPGNADFEPSNHLPAGIQDPQDILSLAKRAKDSGMQIQLSFHYSDYWTNGGLQTKPHAWALLNYDELKQAVYDFTFDFMMQMKEQNTLPEYVSLGNEIAGGIYFPMALQRILQN